MIILCDSWYEKKDLVSIVDEYAILDVICNARYDSVIYDLAPQPTGKRGIPAKHGKRLSPEKDFSLSDEKIRQEIFFSNFMQNIETSIKSTAVSNALKRLTQQRLDYF
ncbi:hypothetical protein [Acetivibrio ethanolgignens]|uniref:Transposase IS701-like DDE domain-containing protein n=1 Tax=Acetivibrio ethanolgignens TaxID=290052 RepID=A0A0V8QHE2_9FIRM|nr:hypothetical protein ASU35_17880 [Acetivibrio ethanolgignens]